MASIEELVALSNEGDLGKFLERRFKGTLTGLFPRRDSDFSVIFGQEPPSRQELVDCLDEYYRSLGYKTRAADEETQGGNSYGFLVYHAKYPDIGINTLVSIVNNPPRLLVLTTLVY